MPKRRSPNSKISERSKTIEAKIEKFIDGVDGETKQQPDTDKNDKRDFKAIRLPFNQWEYEILEAASKKTNRSKTSFIRNAIMEAVEKYST